MKFTLTIGDASANDLARILALISGAVPTVVNGQHSQPPSFVPTVAPHLPNVPDDDESGDTAVAAGTVDKDGLPHDTRIHSDPAKLTGKGVWRKRRGIDDATVAAVEAELRARAGAPMPAAAPMPVPVAMPPMGVPAMPMPVAMPPMGVPAPMPMPVAMPAPMPVAAPVPVAAPMPAAPVAITPPTDFQSFMNGVQVLISAQKVDAEYFANLVAKVNAAWQTQFSAITDIADHPRMAEMVPWIWQTMQVDGRA